MAIRCFLFLLAFFFTFGVLLLASSFFSHPIYLMLLASLTRTCSLTESYICVCACVPRVL